MSPLGYSLFFFVKMLLFILIVFWWENGGQVIHVLVYLYKMVISLYMFFFFKWMFKFVLRGNCTQGRGREV